MIKFVIYNSLMGTYVYRNISVMMTFKSVPEAKNYISSHNLNVYIYKVRCIKNGGKIFDT